MGVFFSRHSRFLRQLVLQLVDHALPFRQLFLVVALQLLYVVTSAFIDSQEIRDVVEATGDEDIISDGFNGEEREVVLDSPLADLDLSLGIHHADLDYVVVH